MERPSWLGEALGEAAPEPLWERLRESLVPASFFGSAALDEATGAKLTIVSELGQHTGSFKYRAALAVALRTQAPRLLTASSGNFGAALAAAAARTGKRCTVVMPERSSAVKIAAVRGHGAEVQLIDTTRTTRDAALAALAAVDPEARAVSPFDDPDVIAGNATLGLEILARGPEVIVAPVGGGGLSSGLCVAKAYQNATAEIVAAEPLLANDAARSLRAGQLLGNEGEPDTICDGARTRSLGRRNFAVLRAALSCVVEVPEATVAQAMALLALHVGLRAEPTGALGLAAVLTAPARFRGRRVACVVSGGSVEPALYERLVKSQS